MMLRHGKQHGFTLIEMMIVVALIAILAGIALPAYNNYISRSKIKTAQADLVALSLNFENHYQRKLEYPENSVDLSDTGKLRDEFKGWSPASTDFNFKTDASVASKSNYKIIAVGTGSSSLSGCEISLNKNNERAIATCTHSASGDWL